MSQTSFDEALFTIVENQLETLENKAHALESVKELMRQATEKLVLQRDFYKTVCGSIQTGVIFLDTSQHIRFLNEQAINLLECNVTNLECHSFFEFFKLAGSANIQDVLNELAGNPNAESQSINGTFILSDHNCINVMGSVSRMNIESAFAGFLIEVHPRSLNSDN